MQHVHVSKHTMQATKTFAEGVSLTMIGVIAAITAATLIYVWLIV